MNLRVNKDRQASKGLQGYLGPQDHPGLQDQLAQLAQL